MSAQREANYLEKIARMIWWELGEDGNYPSDESVLWEGYAALLLIKGDETSSKSVHDIWSLWSLNYTRDRYLPLHKSAIPFDLLPRQTQDLDIRYRDAILEINEQMKDFGFEADGIDRAFKAYLRKKFSDVNR